MAEEQTNMTQQNTYTLTPEERQTIIDLDAAITAKRTAFLQAHKDMDAAKAQFAGAVWMLARSHGMASAKLSPDGTTLTEE